MIPILAKNFQFKTIDKFMKILGISKINLGKRMLELVAIITKVISITIREQGLKSTSNLITLQLTIKITFLKGNSNKPFLKHVIASSPTLLYNWWPLRLKLRKEATTRERTKLTN